MTCDALEYVFQLASEQATSGKGRDRHNPGDLPFEEQKIMVLGRMTGLGGPIFQACKKATEAQLLHDRGQCQMARNELLGSMVYLAAAFILIEETQAEATLHDPRG